jgi:hypothetical protein
MQKVVGAVVSVARRNVVLNYVYWHFMEMPVAILKGWEAFLAFGLHFFSVRLLLGTLFSPFRRYLSVKKVPGFDAWELVQSLIFNAFSRCIGFVIRLCIVLMGLVIEVVILFAGAAVFFVWFLLPLIAVLMVLKGFSIFF